MLGPLPPEPDLTGVALGCAGLSVHHWPKASLILPSMEPFVSRTNV